MGERRPFLWIRPILLLLPLAVILSWLASGWRDQSFGPEAAPPAGATAAVPAFALAGLPLPLEDYLPARLHERVNGAADALIADGCGRLLFWRMEEPPAEIELLIFDSAEGAGRALARELGPDRTPGPGDEAWAGEEAVFFRRGPYYARLLPEAGTKPGAAALLALAETVDAGVQTLIMRGER